MGIPNCGSQTSRNPCAPPNHLASRILPPLGTHPLLVGLAVTFAPRWITDLTFDLSPRESHRAAIDQLAKCFTMTMMMVDDDDDNDGG